MQRRLQDTTRENTGWAVVMQIGDDQAVLMEIIARAMGRAAGGRGRHLHRLLGIGRRAWGPRGISCAAT